jgi:hypothetical protein
MSYYDDDDDKIEIQQSRDLGERSPWQDSFYSYCGDSPSRGERSECSRSLVPGVCLSDQIGILIHLLSCGVGSNCGMVSREFGLHI